jgi:hydrogenase 3 maturation protease
MSTQHQLKSRLNSIRDSAVLIVGVGNILKGDDAAGPLLCEKLKQAGISTQVIDAGTAPENYIQKIINKVPQNLLVVDAIEFGAPPGTIEIFNCEQLDSHAFSTHTLSPRFFVDIIHKSINVDVYFIGIQPAHIQLGSPVSEQVNSAIENLCRILMDIFRPDC